MSDRCNRPLRPQKGGISPFTHLFLFSTRLITKPTMLTASSQKRIDMAAIAFEDVTPDPIVGEAHPVPTSRSVFNYMGQLHHTPNHRRPGLIAPNCTSPEGMTRVRQAYNQLVQAYRTLRDLAGANDKQAAAATSTSPARTRRR